MIYVSIRLIKVIHSSSSMIKAVIFDYNGVLTCQGTFAPLIQEYSVKCGRNSEELAKLVRQYWDLAKLDKIPSMQFWEKIAEFLNQDPQQLRRNWIDSFGFREEMLSVIKQIKKSYKTALLTNEIQDWTEEAIKKYSLETYFACIVPSYQAKAAKPDPKIFHYLLKKLDLTAEECVFIDDQEKNTSAAIKMGFNTILFVSIDQVQKELKVLRIPY